MKKIGLSSWYFCTDRVKFNSVEERMVTFSDVKDNEDINNLILCSQKQLDALGYTEHAMRHITIVSNRAAEILEKLRIW